MQRATINQDARFNPSEAAYEGLVGAALGGLGGAAGIMTRQNSTGVTVQGTDHAESNSGRDSTVRSLDPARRDSRPAAESARTGPTMTDEAPMQAERKFRQQQAERAYGTDILMQAAQEFGWRQTEQDATQTAPPLSKYIDQAFSSLIADSGDAIIQEIDEKEELPHGQETRKQTKHRPESRSQFLGRSLQASEGVFDAGEAAFWFRRPRNISPTALSARQILSDFGVPSIIVEGTIEKNKKDITYLHNNYEGATLSKSIVVIKNDMKASPLEVAAHEACHFWGNTEARTEFEDFVRFQLLFTSDAFLSYQEKISEGYFREKEVDLSDEELMDALFEELIAHIAGQIHSGEYEHILRPILRDYDAVKAAWNQLAEYGRTHPMKLPPSIQWGPEQQEPIDSSHPAGPQADSQVSIDPDAPTDTFFMQSFGMSDSKTSHDRTYGLFRLLYGQPAMAQQEDQERLARSREFLWNPSTIQGIQYNMGQNAEALKEILDRMNAGESFGLFGEETTDYDNVGTTSLAGLEDSSLADLIWQVYASNREKQYAYGSALNLPQYSIMPDFVPLAAGTSQNTVQSLAAAYLAEINNQLAQSYANISWLPYSGFSDNSDDEMGYGAQYRGISRALYYMDKMGESNAEILAFLNRQNTYDLSPAGYKNLIENYGL